MKLSTKHWSALAAVAITGLTLILLWPNQPKEGPTEPQEVGRAYPQAVPQTQPPSPPTKESELTKTDSTESPTPLALLTGETPGKYAERIVAFNEVTNQDLDAPTLTTLLDYLKKPNGHPRNGRPDLVEAAIKNDIIDWLRGRRPLIRELTETLITIGADPTQPIVMRDYALQLLGSWAGDLQKTRVPPTTTPPQAEPTWIPDALAEIETVLWTATEAKDHSYAGTALLSLHRMLEQSSSPGLQSRANQ